MAETPRDYNQWVKSVERRLKQALRNGQSVQAVKLARDVENIRDEIEGGNLGSRVPAAPIELLIETRVLTDVAGIKFGEVSVDFPDVVVDVNARDIDVDRYELWLRDISDIDEDDFDDPGPPLVLYATSSESSLTYSPVTQGRWYEVRVRAVAQGVPGPFSRRYDVQIDKDTTPPPIPSALTLTSSGATVTAAWDLLAGTGDPMPSDFAFTEVAYGWSPAPDGVFAKLSNVFFEYIFETPPEPQDDDYDGTWYFRHRAVDTSGNRSAWSEQSSIVPKKLVDDDSIRFELDYLNDVRLAGLDDRLNNIEPLFDDYDQRIESAEAGAQSARETAETLRSETIPALEGRLDDNDILVGEVQDSVSGLSERVGPALDVSISEAVSNAQSALQGFREEWDENWSETIPGLVDRAEGLESETVRLQNEIDRVLAATGRNIFPDPKFETDYWIENVSGSVGNADDWKKLPTDGSLGEPHSGPPGSAFVLRTGEDGGDPWPTWLRNVPAEAGQVWRFSGWVRTHESDFYAPNTEGSDWAYIQDSNGNRTSTAGFQDFTWRDVTTEWQRFSVDHVVTEDAGWIRVGMRSRAGEGVLIFDDFVVQDITQIHGVLQRLEDTDRDLREEIVTAAGKIVVRSTRPATDYDPHDYFVGTRFEQWSTTDNSATNAGILRTWHASTASDGGIEWVEVALDETYIPQIAIGDGTYGRLSGGRLEAQSIRAESVDMEDFTASEGFIDNAFVHLIQGNQAYFESLAAGSISAETATIARQVVASRNLYNDPNFEKAHTYWNWDVGDGYIERYGVSGLSGTYASTDEMFIPAEPGERFEVSVDITFPDGEGGRAYVYTRSADANKSYIGGSAAGSLLSDSSGHRRATFTAHEDASYVYLGFYLRDVPSSNRVRWENPRVQSALEGRLIVDGLLQATTGELQELFFDSAVGREIAAGSGSFLSLNANQITSGKINTNRLNAQEVASAVGSFLTLDALEINVDELAGQMASIIEITSDAIQARAIQAHHLSVTNFTNLIDDPQFEGDLSTRGSWRTTTGNSWIAAWWGNANVRVLRPNERSSTWYWVRYGEGTIPVQPGESYRFEFTTFSSPNADNWIRVQIEYTLDDGTTSRPGQQKDWRDHDANDRQSFEWTVPDDTSIRFMYLNIAFVNQDKWLGMYNPSLMRTDSAEVIINGLLRASSAELQELFFDNAVGNAMTAGVGRFLEIESNQIKANAVTADKINFGSLNGSLITGLQIQTHTNNRGVKMTSAGLRGYNSSGGETFRVNASNGDVNINSGTITGATFQTHSQSNRGVKILTSGIRAWDNNGNETFNLSASSGNMTATGTWRTARSGDRAELNPTSFGGRLSFRRGSHMATLKLNDSYDRLEMVYSDGSGASSQRPNVGVEETRAMMGYRGQRIVFGGTTSSNQYMRLEVEDGPAEVWGTLQMANSSRMRFNHSRTNDSGWAVGYIGQRPEATSSLFEIRGDGTPLRFSGSRIDAPTIRSNTTTNNANVQITSSGTLRRSTSASRYKVDAREMSLPDSLLDIPVKEWIDLADLERWGDIEGKPRPFSEEDQGEYDSIVLQRIPGVVAEEVESHGGLRFVSYGPEGQIEEVKYDRLGLAQIQVMKRRLEELEEQVRKLKGAS